MDSDEDVIDEIHNEDRPAIRAKLSKDTGYTGRSLLSRLEKLHGFDVCNDLLFDTMHNIPMNVGKKYLDYLVEANLINANEVDERLWRAEQDFNTFF